MALREPGRAWGKAVPMPLFVEAGMIGATRESVNRELRNLRERGLIEVSGKKIGILDLDGLKRRIS